MAQILADYKLNKEMEDAVKASEKQLNEFMKKQSEGAKGVLNRMSGSSDSGLLAMFMKEWVEVYLADKKGKEMEDIVNGSESKFKNLNMRQKGAAKGVAGRANKIEEDNLVAMIFLSWIGEAKFQRIWRHANSKMEGKKHQIDAVRSMFKSFASQLETSIDRMPQSARSDSDGRVKLPRIKQ